MNAWKLLRFERPFLDEFLPYAVVGTEIDVFEELSVEHLVYDTGGLFALYRDLIFLLGSGNRSKRQKNEK